jgi:thermitase
LEGYTVKQGFIAALLCATTSFAEEAVKNEYIVVAKREVPKAQVIASLAVQDLETKQFVGGPVIERLNSRMFRISSNVAMHKMKYDKNDVIIEPNYIYRAIREPNDALYSQLWGMKRMGMPKVWDKITKSPLKVFVVDTGIDYTHEDLQSEKGFNAITGQLDGKDDQGHGTHCAGTIGAVGNNTNGVAGAAWSITTVPSKFLSADGSGTLSDAIKAIDWAVSQKAKILSNSWGGGGYSAALEQAIGAACESGALFIAAAGNESASKPSYPAAYKLPCVLSVAAVGQDDKLASFSNYGAVDIAAPGVGILSTVPGNKYAAYSGTSMATPHVAGAAAILWAANPTVKAADIKKLLLLSTDPVIVDALPWWKKLFGAKPRAINGGILNLGRAFN